MRFFSVVLKANTEFIKENAKIELRQYDYNPISAMNYYIYKNIKNGFCFFVYREESNAIFAAFCYEEKKEPFSGTYNYLMGILSNVFVIRNTISEPCEITMLEFFDCIVESKRRDYLSNWSRVVEAADLDGLYYYCKDRSRVFYYELKEKIVPKKHKKESLMYDKNTLSELSNIESHKKLSEFKGNIMVHYVVSCRSEEAANDITEILSQRLAESNRLISRRMEIISEITPDVYRNSYFEELIENNYGGVTIIDLSEKFGYNSADYGMACKYIEKIVKKYRNHCLFVFTYNINNPGFAYQLLSSIQKNMLLVTLKEGKGSRKTAVSYMKELIKASEYSKYASQANEFMKQFPGDVFTHTDVIAAFEQFEPWCLNKNIFQAYNYCIPDTYMLDRDEDTGSSCDKLNNLIGLTKVKERINHIVAADIAEKERKKRRGSSYKSGTMHMIFGGNPGTAKTTVAKLFAGIAKEKGILKSGAFVECGGMDLDGLGCTIAIREAFMAAKGGVLFIDEAYSLKSDTAVTVLIQEMENRREDVIVVLAGYNERMRAFLETNDGLKSRIPYWVDFPDYSADELTEIFKMMIKERGFAASESAVTEARSIFEKARLMDNFGNGRYVRNLIDCAVQNQSVRLLADGGNAEDIQGNQLFLIEKDDISTTEEGLKNGREAGTAEKELDEMIGLSSVKTIINKAIASFRLKKICMEKGIRQEKPSLHMVFSGNPGTAKTTVARLFAEIMKDEKILPSGNFVEAGRADLVGDHVGATAPLVKKKFKEAQGGVLFIDEAYSLCDGYENGFGDEAINTLVQEMENHRDNVIVIFAGYPDKMELFFERNPGMASRVAFYVKFEDYSVDELCEITKFILSRKQMTITASAMEKLKKAYETAREDSGFGNGRFVRKILEEAEMNLAERVSRLDESMLTAKLITTIEEADIPKSDKKKYRKKNRIGFSTV